MSLQGMDLLPALPAPILACLLPSLLRLYHPSCTLNITEQGLEAEKPCLCIFYKHYRLA